MSDAIWQSGKSSTSRRKRRRERRKSRAHYVIDYDLAYDGGGSAFSEYYRTRLGARIAAFFEVHINSWGGSAKLYPYPRPEPMIEPPKGIIRRWLMKRRMTQTGQGSRVSTSEK